MKAIKIINETKEVEIDWSKPQWVKRKAGGDCIVLTTGEHGLVCFTGTAMPCLDFPDGDYSENWTKEYFTPLTGPTTIEISN